MNTKDTAVLETKVGGASQTLQDIEAIRDKVRDLKQSTLELNAAKAQQDAQIQKNKATLNAYEKQLADANRTVAKASEKNIELGQKLSDLENKNQKGSDQWNRLSTAINENNAKIAEAESVIKDVTVKHNELLAVQKEEIGTRNGLNKQIRENNLKVKEQVAEMNRLNGTLDITEMSYNQLSAKAMQLRRELNNTSKAADPEQWNRLDKELGDVERQMEKVRAGSKQTSNEMSGLKGVVSKVSLAIKGFIIYEALRYLKDLVVAVFNVRKEFAKYGVTLQNALQSHLKSVIAMKMLKDLALETTFEFDQLTESYIKMVNRGIIPSKNEIIKLGDLAESQGKSMDQLVEGLLDAQTGEFERLKEFGIRARKEGDKVKFSFRGITTEVQFTDKAIKDYIISLGNLEGVQGAMKVQMSELTGLSSNLSDEWKQLLNSLGELLEPVFKGILKFTTALIKSSKELVDYLDLVISTKRKLKNLEEGVAINAYDDTLNQVDFMVEKLVKKGMDKRKATEISINALRKQINSELVKEQETLNNLENKLFYGLISKNDKYLQSTRSRVNTLNAEITALDDKLSSVSGSGDKNTELTDKDSAKKAEAAEKAALKARMDAIDQYIIEKKTKLTQDLLDGKMMYEEYNLEMQALELENLNKKLEVQGLDAEARKKVELDVLEFKKKMMDEEFEEYVELVDKKGKETEKERRKQATRLDQLADDLNAYVERINQSSSEAMEVRKNVGSAILDFASDLGQTLGESLTETEATFADVMGNILLLALDSLRQMVALSIAESTIRNAPKGPLGWAKAAAEIAIINAAFYAVKGIIKKPSVSSAKGSDSGNNDTETGSRVVGLASGGYMPVTRAQDGANYMASYDPGRRGFVTQPTVLVGESGPEFVVSNAGINNPTIRPLIDFIDASQRAGNIRTVDLNQIMRSRMAGFASGGFTNQQPATAPEAVPAAPATTADDTSLRPILTELIFLLRDLRKKGIDARVVYSQFEKTKEVIERSREIGGK